MQKLGGTVGEGGANARHDVALVQALLALATRPVDVDPTRQRYLSTIDGECNDATKRAIRQFQDDHTVGDPGTDTSYGPSGLLALAVRAATGMRPGLVSAADATWSKLVAAVPVEFRDLRVLDGSKTVYVAGTGAQLSASLSFVGRLTFKDDFREKVKEVVQRLYQDTGIVATPCHTITQKKHETRCDADRRSFQKQYELFIKRLPSGARVTWVGPGESNHNFGQAVDMGFKDLRWLHSDGTVEEQETSWLHKLDPDQVKKGAKPNPEALIFWKALRDTAERLGLFGLDGDRPHLQAWKQGNVSMYRSLADLLTRAAAQTDHPWRWEGRRVMVKVEGKEKKEAVGHYKCDLGTHGNRFFEVGTSVEIWTQQGPVTDEMVRVVREHAETVARRHFAGPRGGGEPGAHGVPAAATNYDAAGVRKQLRSAFDQADRKWREWNPLP